ncbi:hypothetical protein D6T69_02525 [Tenacibaculum singaporense]|uniref:Uncharacterized protein n=1 Tax=Tenacibaculum singaporense TaxID=2358479 RepID=A0A3Q8RNV2_9FLAO|nr:hypothetical protein D6T69_02525 [Tenacibaculum singaporense]
MNEIPLFVRNDNSLRHFEGETTEKSFNRVLGILKDIFQLKLNRFLAIARNDRTPRIKQQLQRHFEGGTTEKFFSCVLVTFKDASDSHE